VKRLFLIGAIFSILNYPLLFNLASPTLALLNPEFSVYLTNPQPSFPSDVDLNFSFPQGTEIPTKIDMGIPAGFELSPSSAFPSYTIVGEGYLDGWISGSYYPGFITLYNIAGGGTRWRIYLTFPDISYEMSYPIQVTGNSQQGYTFSLPDLADPASLGLTAPSSWHLTIFGDEYPGDGVTPYVITTPAVGGTYNWTAKFYGEGETTIDLENSTGIIGTPVDTPTCESGQCDPVDLPNDISITFNNVSGGGETTVSVSPTAPIPPDSGQFQVVPGGLYYDFTTNATYLCPCLITLPYNPAVTPDPKIYHLNTDTGIWEDVTISFSPDAQTVTGQVSSLSFFVVATTNLKVDWRLPLQWPNGQESVFSRRILILPIIFSLLDSNGQYVERTDVTVQVSNSNGQVVAEFPPRYILRDGKFYIAMLKVRQLNLSAGKYTAKVKVGNTVIAPAINFSLR
jgi:hypothetical protein